VRGRITQKQLPLAEKSFPGINRFYRGLTVKPATFLQLVWQYEHWAAAAGTAARRRAVAG
jgi:hypothetical protein